MARTPRTAERPQQVAVPERISAHTTRNLILIVLAVLLVASATIILILLPSPVENTQDTPVDTAPVVEDPPAQTEPEVTMPTHPMIVEYRVVWQDTGVSGRLAYDSKNPSLDQYTAIATEEGFYNGSMPGEISFSPSSTEPDHESARFAWQVLPQLEGEQRVRVAAAKDISEKEVVLVVIDADRHIPFLLLSLDGEDSWCSLNSQLSPSVGYPRTIRVTANNDNVSLYVRDGTTRMHWWTAKIEKSKLPCF